MDNKKGNIKHGEHGTVLYNKWKSMRGRVSTHPHYIKNKLSCSKEWDSFLVFKKWSLSNGYKEDLSLDRIDTYKGYSASNCRWVSKRVQSENIRKRKDNTSGYSGVSLDKRNNKYKIQIQVNGEKIYIGRADTAIEGALMFDDYIIKNNTNHRLNFGLHHED